MLTDPVFAAPGRFLKGNIHTHSNVSDGRLSPAEVCDAYRAGGHQVAAGEGHARNSRLLRPALRGRG
jgi:histidinol phosphatase-like PHP family hydrolase